MQSRTLTAFLVVLAASVGSAAVALIAVNSLSGPGEFELETTTLMFVLGASLLLSAAATFGLLRRIDRPVSQLRQSMRSALEGDYRGSAAKKLTSSDDELTALAQDFDRMTARVRGHLSTRSRILRNISEALRAPLSRLQAISSLMRQRSGEDGALADRMESELNSLHQLVAEVLTYSQLETKNSLKRQRTNLTDMIRTIAADAALSAAGDEVTVSMDAGEDIVLDVEHGVLYAAIENLVQHALLRAESGGGVTLGVTQRPGDTAIFIQHVGQPILDAATLDHLFEPFANNPEKSGMSLAVARRAVLLHGGSIEATNNDNGLLVTASLPGGTR